LVFFFSVEFLLKKIIKPKVFIKKIKTGLNRLVLVWFGFLEQKPVQTGLA